LWWGGRGGGCGCMGASGQARSGATNRWPPSRSGIAYSPCVAVPVLALPMNEIVPFDTPPMQFVAVITNGTAILGLERGALADKPVREGRLSLQALRRNLKFPIPSNLSFSSADPVRSSLRQTAGKTGAVSISRIFAPASCFTSSTDCRELLDIPCSTTSSNVHRRSFGGRPDECAGSDRNRYQIDQARVHRGRRRRIACLELPQRSDSTPTTSCSADTKAHLSGSPRGRTIGNRLHSVKTSSRTLARVCWRRRCPLRWSVKAR